jgi:hypothetical protein
MSLRGACPLGAKRRGNLPPINPNNPPQKSTKSIQHEEKKFIRRGVNTKILKLNISDALCLLKNSEIRG